MIVENFSEEVRGLKKVSIDAGLVVVGGGMAGACAAISAAREGVKVVLVQDRPVLGGNASSEVRLWILGATSHLGNNNRWSREGGVIDEILVENLYRNKEGNAIILDTIILEKVRSEPNITLLLNTAAYEVEKSSPTKISKVWAFCSQNLTRYELNAPLFCDASGDGVVGFAAGAAFRMGAESKDEFGELFAPDAKYGELLGHTIYFYTKDIGKPVDYVAPDFALKDITKLPKYRSINVKDHGCKLWWVEYGGSLDTIHDSEEIKWELWKIVYGIWDHIKNSGEFPEAENLTLEWVGTIPGKRESRRFEGDYMLTQRDVVDRVDFKDAVSFGGWAIDLHPEDGVYNELPSCTQWHGKGVYQIPYRCFYSRNIENLFLAGRIISASHVAFGTTRVMATCGHGGMVIGHAAAQCLEEGVSPRDLLESERMKRLQNSLNKEGQSIPKFELEGDGDLAQAATLSCSSVDALASLPASDSEFISLENASGQWLPLKAGVQYRFTVQALSKGESEMQVKLRAAEEGDHYTPDRLIESKTVTLVDGEQTVEVVFENALDRDQYALLSFHGDASVKLRASDVRQTGTVSAFNVGNAAVSNNGVQSPPEGIGIDSFEFWRPLRRPDGLNIAFEVSPALEAFGVDLLKNGYTRPNGRSNAWVASLADESPELTLNWSDKITVKEIYLYFDSDFDHPMESSQFGHPERVVPFTVNNYQVVDGEGNVLQTVKGNHQTINRIVLPEAIETDRLVVKLEHPSETVPAALFGLRCYSE
ncbi:FAD-dependent oxidoreductase [Pelagicoccus mobilis]|uniref:FAD-dependent oxidoreductase n=1 Tax=Pelagicoccus mobilis TaxID=415221 RepID=A0A934VMK9_9BACT|nr:FAD-dependent oxidoreductase [Pelagicoccus mobilis]MBK1878961.1 FAD-dependent oxidoreductase [Pelagicoccus mobilis]